MRTPTTPILAALLLSLALTEARGQGVAAPAGPTETAAAPDAPGAKDALLSLLARLSEIDRAIAAKKKSLDGAAGDDEKAAAASELARLRAERSALQSSFARLATGVDLGMLDDQPEEKPDWQQELFSLVQPLLREMKSATAGARRIDQLELEIGKLEGRAQILDRALASTAATRTESSQDARVTSELDALTERLHERRGIVQSQLDVARHELAGLERARRPFTDTMRDLLRGFFATRGRNFMLAVAAMVGVFVGLRLAFRAVVRLSPAHRREVRGFTVRFLDVLAHLCAAAGSIGALVAVLYSSGDWLLLSIASVLLIGLAVTARATIPRMANTILFLLNLGTVREGERLVYEGLPWRVKRLGFSALLENPELEGGGMVLPIRELLGRYSRKTVPGEPWFPTRKGDYVELASAEFGRIACQTAEVVVIETDRGRTMMPTAAFLGSGARNLSTGFTVKKVFAVSHAPRRAATAGVPAALAADVRAAFSKGPWAAGLEDVVVEVENAASPPALEYAVLVRFGGTAASGFPAIGRALARALVESAASRGYDGAEPLAEVAGEPQAALAGPSRS